MTKFEENNSQRLKAFLKQLNELVDEFHPNIYLMDEVFEGLEKIEKAIKKEIEL
jgi:Holliday junction resolvasome RuvABC endonuclease subunit